MKYLKAIFNIADACGNKIKDEVLAQTIKDILCQLAGTAGFESFEENEFTVTGYVQRQLFDKNLLEDSIRYFPVNGVNITYTTQEAEDKNWNEAWEEKGFEPIIIDGKCVVHDTLHEVTEHNGMLDITIDAKQAFGTGNHETTYMITDELLNTDIKSKRVLDCGCGTGILSIISAKLGAKSVTGYDIDEWSVENTRHNCSLNGVDNVRVIHGDASVIATLTEKFDIVIANINRNILLNDMPAFISAMNDKAMLILSGFYADDAVMLTGKAEESGLKATKQKTKNDWCMLVFEQSCT